MYWVKSNYTTLYHPFSEDDIAISATFVDELNTHGSMDITIDDPTGVKLHLLDPIAVYDEDDMKWRGRVLSIDGSLNDSRKDVHCEGALAFLCDTIVPPFTFRGRPDSYTNEQQQRIKGLFECLIDNHNNQLSPDDPRRFTLGRVTVSDPNNYIFRSSESALTTWEVITTRLIDTLGGYVYLSGDELNVINYVSDFSETATQRIQFGENLVSLVQTGNADGIVTVLIPYGAKSGDDPEPTGSGFITWDDNRLTLDSPVEYQPAIDRWGRIYGTATWDDITLSANLSTAATKWLQDNFNEHIDSIEITAADLAEIDASIDKFKVGQYVGIVCSPLNINAALLCVRKETDIIDVSQSRIFISHTPNTLTQMVGG